MWVTLPAKVLRSPNSMLLFPAVIQAQSHSMAEALTKERKRPHESKDNRCRDALLTPQQRNGVTPLTADLHYC